jgi:hypothetical protein
VTRSWRLPVPFAFVLVIGLTIALIIFFGAWAVAADAGNERSLTFGLPGTTDVGPEGEAQGADQADSGPFRVARLGEQEDGADDTWWGQAFLKACPLH